MPYRKILCCVDNSTPSGHAVNLAAAIARAFGSSVVAAHVYAARLHDRRFLDLEPGLPQEYLEPKRLEVSRRTHDALIGKGLRLISDSYLEAARARLNGIPLETRSIEGKNYVELARESMNGYHLAVVGARGLGLACLEGCCPVGTLGSVCERFLRRARTDVLIARDSRSPSGTILVGLDGSPESYAALRRALQLAAGLGGRVQAAACFDPDFHAIAFRSIAGVLSEKDAGVFRFSEQEKLHNRTINHGLENLYGSYLEQARILAQGRGQPVETRLLRGKPGYELARLAEQIEPALLVVGRFGLHHTDDLDIGSTAETIVRLAPGNVLVVNGTPEDQPLAWTREAEQRLENVPEFMRPMVKKAVEFYARSHGISEITTEVVSAAKLGHGVPMPGHGKDLSA